MLTDSFHMDTAQGADPRGLTDDAPTTLPFTIEADLDLGVALEPWLRASGADVTIRRGDVPTALAAPESEDVVWQQAGQRTLFRFPCGVRLLVEDGRSVRYAMERGATPHDVRTFLLGRVWGALAMQRGLLPLHASSVTRGPDLDAFTGRSGMGKSTLAAALGSHGYPLFTDDVLLVGPASFGAGPLCHGHRTLSLGREGLALSGVESEAAAPLRMKRGRQGVPKWYAVPVRQARQRAGRLRSLYFLSYRNNVPGQPPCGVERLAGRQAVQSLQGAVYRPRQANAIMGRSRIVSLLAGILRHTRMFVFHRRRCDADVTWFAEDVTRLAAELRTP